MKITTTAYHLQQIFFYFNRKRTESTQIKLKEFKKTSKKKQFLFLTNLHRGRSNKNKYERNHKNVKKNDKENGPETESKE